MSTTGHKRKRESTQRRGNNYLVNSNTRAVRYRESIELGSGAFGVVHQAVEERNPRKSVAIKHMKTKREEFGIPHDAYREIKILREIMYYPPELSRHIVHLERVYQNNSANSVENGIPTLNLVYSYAEHDLSELIRFHRTTKRPFDRKMIKSIIWQILKGLDFLHRNWIMHRDIKPANILVMDEPSSSGSDVGLVQLADFGLARIFHSPLRSLGSDGDVVTIWYRAPELLLGSQHYTRAVDMWAVGCIFAELFMTIAIFTGTDVKQKNSIQRDQLEKIFRVLGKPTEEQWPEIVNCKWYEEIKSWDSIDFVSRLQQVCKLDKFPLEYDLLSKMLDFNPSTRIIASEALEHRYFKEQPKPENNVFLGSTTRRHKYPSRAQRLQMKQRQAPSRRKK